MFIIVIIGAGVFGTTAFEKVAYETLKILFTGITGQLIEVRK